MMEHSKENIANFNKMKNQINNNTRNLFISNQITACTMILQELSEDVNLVIDTINDGKHGIIHPQLLTPRIFIDELKDFENTLNVKYPIPLKDVSYQHIIDISEIGIVIYDGKLLYSTKIPVLEDDQFQIQHLIPIPQKRGINFVAPIPRDEYILINEQRTVYVPTDKNLLNDCKNYDKIKICQRSQPTYLISETHTCENQIIRASIKSLDYKICQVSPFRIESLTYFTLTGSQGYILIPENELSLSVNCPSNSEEVVIREATLIR